MRLWPGLALLLPLAATAVPPAFPFRDGLAPATLKLRPATQLNLDGYTIHFQQTSMLEVQRTLGGSIRHQGDAGGSLDWLCYRIPGTAQQLLWITSGELQGGQIVDGVVARQANVPAVAEDCTALPERFLPVSLGRGLWLGADGAALQGALGKPSATRGNWLEWCFEAKGRDERRGAAENTTAAVDYDEFSSLVLRLEGGRVVELFADQDTTY